MNAVIQDAFLGRDTESPYLNKLNHISLVYDENAPTCVPDEFMRALGLDITIQSLEFSVLEAKLQAKYGKACNATGDDKLDRDRRMGQLRAAKQRRRRKVAQMLCHEYFENMNREELNRQLCGNHGPHQPLQKVIFTLPERRHIADLIGDLKEDLPEPEIVRRKVATMNAWLAYAWKTELREPKPQQDQTRAQPPSTEVIGQAEAPQVFWKSVYRHPTAVTALIIASYWRHEAVVRLLFEKGAATETADSLGQTPLSWAAE